MSTLAIIAPDQNAYSETFIQAHRKLPFNIRFYYGGFFPSALDGSGNLIGNGLRRKIYAYTGHEQQLKHKTLKRSLKKEGVQCVLAEYGPTACEVLPCVKELNIPLIVHFHGYDASAYNIITTYRQRYKEVFDYASSIIVVSQEMRRDILALGCPENKLAYAPCGPQSGFFSIQPHFSNRQFVSIGRFVEKKAPHLTILAFSKVRQKYSDAKLIMVGDGELMNTCQALVTALKLKEAVEFLKVQSHTQIGQLFGNSIAFVQHSIMALNGDKEGTPVAVMEAQAAGLPVVATRHAGIKDVVLHEETGLLCDEYDIESMAQNMTYILDHPEYASSWGANAKVRIQNNFSLEKHLNLITDVVKSAISK